MSIAMSIAVDLHFIVNGPDHQTNFRTQLLKLIMKADGMAVERLRDGFPEEVAAVQTWQRTGVIPGLSEEAGK